MRGLDEIIAVNNAAMHNRKHLQLSTDAAKVYGVIWQDEYGDVHVTEVIPEQYGAVPHRLDHDGWMTVTLAEHTDGTVAYDPGGHSLICVLHGGVLKAFDDEGYHE